MLVPSAPCLLPELTGGSVSDLAGVRDAVGWVLGELVAARPDRVVVAARPEPGTLAGFGVAPTAKVSPGGRGWPHELGSLLLARNGWPGVVEAADTTESAAGALACAASVSDVASRTAVLVLADGSATRGPRAPGGEDPRGDDLDAVLVRDLRAGRIVTPSDVEAAAVGCRGLPGLTMFGSLRVAVPATADASGEPGVAHPTGRAGHRTDVRYEGAPTGVGYVVAVRPRRAP